MKFHTASIVLALILALPSLALADAPATQPLADLQLLSVRGGGLSEQEASDLEHKVSTNPDDAESRATLLGYYFIREFRSAEVRQSRRGHIFWMIQNRPADPYSGSPYCQFNQMLDPDGFFEASTLWRKQVDLAPTSTAVLGNAASFFLLSNSQRAESYLHRAETADPKDPQWPSKLAQLYMLSRMGQPPELQQAAAKHAMTEYEQALSLTLDPAGRFYLLTSIPAAAFASGDMNKAHEYAQQTLTEAENFPKDWNYGNAIFSANNVLGEIALANGDLDTARQRLLAAARTPGSPQLDSFGPNVALASQLLAKGDRKTVIAFLDLCSQFWTSGASRLKAWKDAIQSGDTPDWGLNLNI